MAEVMRRYLKELIEAFIVAAIISLPLIIYFWSMKP